MNTQIYDNWVKSHQSSAETPDLTDMVMNRITQKAHQPNIVKTAWQQILLDFIQARMFARTCVVASGALIGLLRMIAQIYSVLFT